MKNFLLLLAGIAAAATCYMVARPATRPSRTPRSIDDLAHNLQDAWADHHTIA